MTDRLWQNAIHEESLNMKFAPAVFPIAELNADQLPGKLRSNGDTRQPALAHKYQIEIPLA